MHNGVLPSLIPEGTQLLKVKRNCRQFHFSRTLCVLKVGKFVCGILGMSDSHVLLDLPLGPLREILVDWLVIEEVVVLDSALCNRSQLAMFLNRIDNDVIVFNTRGYWLESDAELKWLLSRKVRVRLISLSAKVVTANTATLRRHFLRFAGKHLAIVHFDQTRSQGKNLNSILADVCVNCGNLTDLVANEAVVGESISSVLQNCTKLERMSLQQCSGLQTDYFNGFTCGKLINVDLSGVATVELLSALAIMCPNLTHLTLNESIGLTAIGSAASSFPNLVYLAARKCSLLTDASITHFFARSKKLTEVYLSYCHRLTDASFQCLAENCPMLEIVYMSQCIITDQSFRALSKCTHLKELWCVGCAQITDAGLLAIADRCVNLQSINLRMCYLVADAGVIAVVKKCVNLQVMVLQSLAQLTDATLSAISEYCHNLQLLDLRKTASLSDDAIMNLAGRCSSLRRLFVSQGRIMDNPSVKLLLKRLAPELEFWN